MSRRLLAWIVLVLSCQACADFATYGENRVRDLSDVIDVRYGTGFGLGAQAQVGAFEAGLGCSVEWYYRQWFGRKSVEVREGLFADALIFGIDGDYVRRLGADDWWHEGNASTGSMHVILYNTTPAAPHSVTGNENWFSRPGGDPPLLDELRAGGVAFLPGVNGGLYLNLGEIGDFLCGLVGYDLNNDDGIPKFRLIDG